MSKRKKALLIAAICTLGMMAAVVPPVAGAFPMWATMLWGGAVGYATAPVIVLVALW